MKICLLNFLISLGLTVCSNCMGQDTIRWRSDYKLKWEDFQGVPDSSSGYKAVTVADLSSVLSYNNSTFNVKVACAFDKKKSWTLSTGQNLLSHEQGHFNIAELFARKLRKAFKEYKFDSKTIEADYIRIFSRIKIERAKMDALYDKETNQSRNISKQLYWNKKIDTELKKFDRYAQ